MEKDQLYPEDFLRKMRDLLQEEEYSLLIKALAQPPPVSIRLNPFKKTDCFKDLEPVPWCSGGYYLPSRPVFTTDPIFQAGGYYVQEASSMFIEQVINSLHVKNKNLSVLDLSAAPGGKSTHLLSLLSSDSLLVSNEVIRSRVNVLEENLVKWGCSNYIVTNNDPADFTRLSESFDIILVDAPCSGEGMFRKDKEAALHWDPENINVCVSRQERILSNILPSLKSGGFLIYSTCTWNEEENESNIINLMLKEEFSSLRIPLNPEWGIKESQTVVNDNKLYTYRFFPHKLKGEGFTISCIQKAGASENQPEARVKRAKVTLVSANDRGVVQKWISNPENFEFIIINDYVFAIKKSYFNKFLHYKDNLYIKAAGLKMGKIIRNDLIPSHELAQSIEISSAIPAIELQLKEAINYLRKDQINIDTGNVQGWSIVKYKGLNLGWIKILNNRINNYFPVEQRIRMQA